MTAIRERMRKMTKYKKTDEYALYKGEDCLATGTIKEIAEQMNVKEKTIYFYIMPSYKKRCKKSDRRLVMVKI
jgi:hypothetical protein